MKTSKDIIHSTLLDSGWFIGSNLPSCSSLSCLFLENDTSVKQVFGWDYSDENLIWPITDNLFIIGTTEYHQHFVFKNLCLEFPRKLTISSNTSELMKINPYMYGVFERSFNVLKNGRPIWEHRYFLINLFYNGNKHS